MEWLRYNQTAQFSLLNKLQSKIPKRISGIKNRDKSNVNVNVSITQTHTFIYKDYYTSYTRIPDQYVFGILKTQFGIFSLHFNIEQ